MRLRALHRGTASLLDECNGARDAGVADARLLAAAGSVAVALLAYLIAFADLAPSGPVDDPLDPLEQPLEHDIHGTGEGRALLH